MVFKGWNPLRNSLYNSQKVQLGTEVRVDPRVILSSQILQLSRQELEAAIENELADNPALERLEEDVEVSFLVVCWHAGRAA